MKRLYTISLMIMLALAAKAQVFMADEEGNLYGDGDVMSLRSFEDPDWGDVMLPAPIIVNKGAAAVSVRMDVDIREIPASTLVSDCFSGNCTNFTAVGKHSTATKNVKAGGELPTAIEWSCWSNSLNDYASGYCWVDFTLYVNGQKDKTVSVVYSNNCPDAADAISRPVASRPICYGTYTLSGQKAGHGAKGIVIRDGKKYIVK